MDPGRAVVTQNTEHTGAFRPTLRNVELTAPYMHDGSLATLEDVVDFYVDGGIRNPHLSDLIRPLEFEEEDRAAMVAFLKALTSKRLPQLDECDKLLAEGRPGEAFALFRAESERDPSSSRAAIGLARSAVQMDERDALFAADRALRSRIRAVSPQRTDDTAAAELLVQLGRVAKSLSNHEDALALARGEDALIAWKRVRQATDVDPEIRDRALELETSWLETMGRRDQSIELLHERVQSPKAPGAIQELYAATLYRRGWRAYASDAANEAAREDLAVAAGVFDELAADPDYAMSSEGRLFRAYARHYLAETGAALVAYRVAIRDESIAEQAINGLRSLLWRDHATFTVELNALANERPDSPHQGRAPR